MTALNLARIDIRQIAEPGAVAAANDPAPVKLVMPSANDADSIPGLADLTRLTRRLSASEAETAEVVSRSQAVLNKFEAKKIVDKIEDKFAEKPVEAERPASSRAASLASRMSSDADTAPHLSRHLADFEATNKQIVEAQRSVAAKYGAALEYADKNTGNFDPAKFHAAIEASGHTVADYEADVSHIQSLSQRSASHLERLQDNIAAYKTKNPNDREALEETAERVQASLTDLSAGPGVPKEEHGEVIDVTQKLKEMIERVIELIRALFAGKEAKPA